ncbi:MAG: hypothetical protein LRZ85_05760 [Alphaproteobacteria bacterium]|nr:hypothetical protein [Alphaproteobacteria bacterium]MCD8520127.1 hypothetical protein [Alphaproteobacteria bacterium]MCD8525944.1 hypothetical protein [Alphaproteobacteria bacterium]MCD8571084.1 hypothetical protein [Alphaproteobacteria bacterium]
MRLFSLISLAFAAFLLMSFPASAQETYECGVPDNPMLEKTDDPELWRYCDYYTRRFQYIEEQKRFRQQLDERRANYVRYREAAVNNYKDELELYYDMME